MWQLHCSNNFSNKSKFLLQTSFFFLFLSLNKEWCWEGVGEGEEGVVLMYFTS